jgi:hypothetical protein
MGKKNNLVIIKEMRSGIDRRKFTYTDYIPERRSGRDRRTIIYIEDNLQAYSKKHTLH